MMCFMEQKLLNLLEHCATQLLNDKSCFKIIVFIRLWPSGWTDVKKSTSNNNTVGKGL